MSPPQGNKVNCVSKNISSRMKKIRNRIPANWKFFPTRLLLNFELYNIVFVLFIYFIFYELYKVRNF